MICFLRLGVFSLGLSGLYSLALVLMRTPVISSLISDKSFFKSALVVHVNLSVLVWLLSITCYFWSLGRENNFFVKYYKNLAFIGVCLMAISPLLPIMSSPVMNNYVPMLENIVFIIGLSLFASCILLFALQIIAEYLFLRHSAYSHEDNITITIANFTTALMYICAFICIYLSYIQIHDLAKIVPLDIEYYYEMLFWSGGHLLQFIYTQIFMLALVFLAENALSKRLKFTYIYELIMLVNFVLAMFIFYGHWQYELADGNFKLFFTYHMKYFGGICPAIFILLITYEMLHNLFFKNLNKAEAETPSGPLHSKLAILFSIFLFCYGGVIAIFIKGVNVTIPAHYHGSIVGISICFMGFVYVCIEQKINYQGARQSNLLIKHLGIQVAAAKSESIEKAFQNAKNQLIVIFLGQFMHILGLALAGGYGVMRKTTGVDIPLQSKLYMGLMGMGGLIAIIGGLMFVYICAISLAKNKQNS